jgi:hypothetical protein
MAECPAADRAWKPDAPQALQSTFRHSYPGWQPAGAEGLGLGTRPAPAAVPFLGNTVYRTSYTGKAAAPTDVLKEVLQPVIGVSLDGRTTASTAYLPHAHLPATEYQAPAERAKRVLAPAAKALFDDATSYALHYPAYGVVAPAESARRPQSAASGAPFAGATTYQEVYTPKEVPASERAVQKRGGGFEAGIETRDWRTQAGDDYVPLPLEGLACPAASLPRPPSPSAAPQAWEADAAGNNHVLWDTTRRQWAL